MMNKGFQRRWESSQPKYRINLDLDESIMKCEFPTSFEIDIPENAKLSIKSTFQGIVMEREVEGR
jgi:hypothetical protein